MQEIDVLQLAINSIILIVLIGVNREALHRIRNIIDILSNGAYKNCPFFRSEMKGGRRLYDPKGGEKYERNDSSPR